MEAPMAALEDITIEASFRNSFNTFTRFECDNDRPTGFFHDTDGNENDELRRYEIRLSTRGNGREGLLREISLSGSPDFWLEREYSPQQLELIGFLGMDWNLSIYVWHDASCPDGSEAEIKLLYNNEVCRLPIYESGPPQLQDGPVLFIKDSQVLEGIADPNDGVIDFTPANTALPRIFDVTFRNIGDEPLVINSASSTGAVSVSTVNNNFPITVNPGRFGRIKMVHARLDCGTYEGELTLDTDATIFGCSLAPDNLVLPYRQVSYYQCPGTAYSVAVDDIEQNCRNTQYFATESNGGPSTRLITITNQGTIPLQWSAGLRDLIRPARGVRPFEMIGAFDSSVGLTRIEYLAPGASVSFMVDVNSACDSGNCSADLGLTLNRQLCILPLRVAIQEFDGGTEVSKNSVLGKRSGAYSNSSTATLYPTVTDGKYTLDFSAPLTISQNYYLYDTGGRMVRAISVNKGATSVRGDVGDLPAGMYYVKLAGNQPVMRMIRR